MSEQSVIAPEQIRSTCFWEKAIYIGKWDDRQITGVPDEPRNTEFIAKHIAEHIVEEA